jgi:hypothetical protein
MPGRKVGHPRREFSGQPWLKTTGCPLVLRIDVRHVQLEEELRQANQRLLRSLEERIDEVGGTSQWIGRVTWRFWSDLAVQPSDPRSGLVACFVRAPNGARLVCGARKIWQARSVGSVEGEWWIRGWRKAGRVAGVFRWFVLIAAVLGRLSAAGSAHASELSVRGPEPCADAAELAFRIERAIGMPLAQAAPLRFVVVFESPATPRAAYTARLEIEGDEPHRVHTRRQISARDCARLGDAVSVAIALAIGSNEPQLALAASEAGRASPAQSKATAAFDGAAPLAAGSADAEDVRAPPATEQKDTAFTPVLALSVLLDSGSLPAPGLGVGLGVELRGQRFAVRGNGTLLFDQHVALEEGVAAPGADMSLLFGSLSACTAPVGSFRASFAAFACAGWELGRLAAVGTGVPSPRRGDELWSAPRLDACLSWAAPGTAFRFDIQLTAAAPLKRDDFFLRDLGSVHRPPAAVGRFAVGVDVSIE